jgi:hypothetical protein
VSELHSFNLVHSITATNVTIWCAERSFILLIGRTLMRLYKSILQSVDTSTKPLRVVIAASTGAVCANASVLDARCYSALVFLNALVLSQCFRLCSCDDDDEITPLVTRKAG